MGTKAQSSILKFSNYFNFYCQGENKLIYTNLPQSLFPFLVIKCSPFFFRFLTLTDEPAGVCYTAQKFISFLKEQYF